MEVRHHRFNRITFDPDKCFGKACIRGLRMPVASILAQAWKRSSASSSGHSVRISSTVIPASSVLEERVVPFEEPASQHRQPATSEYRQQS